MGNGQLKAAYNVQISTENQFIVASTLLRRLGDTACMTGHLEHVWRLFKALPAVLVADAGYGSEENYAYLAQNDVRAFMKYNLFYKERRARLRRTRLSRRTGSSMSRPMSGRAPRAEPLPSGTRRRRKAIWDTRARCASTAARTARAARIKGNARKATTSPKTDPSTRTPCARPTEGGPKEGS